MRSFVHVVNLFFVIKAMSLTFSSMQSLRMADLIISVQSMFRLLQDNCLGAVVCANQPIASQYYFEPALTYMFFLTLFC